MTSKNIFFRIRNILNTYGGLSENMKTNGVRMYCQGKIAATIDIALEYGTITINTWRTLYKRYC